MNKLINNTKLRTKNHKANGKFHCLNETNMKIYLDKKRQIVTQVSAFVVY